MTINPNRSAIILHRAIWPALGLSIIGFFGAAAVTGPTGMMAYGDYQTQLAKRQALFVKLDAERRVMQNRVALLDPRSADPDLVEELARERLNVVRPDEVIVPLD